MNNYLPQLLSRITMYRLMLYFLLLLIAVNLLLSALGVFLYSPWDILFQAVYLVAVCVLANRIFARLFSAKPNIESPLITGLILSLIMGPFEFGQAWLTLTAVAVLAISSKYLVTIRKSHIFNPAAFGALASGLLLGQPATWWVGGTGIWLLLLAGGLLVITKIKRFALLISFLFTYLALSGTDLFFTAGLDISQTFGALSRVVLSPATLFFIFVTLVEPLTSPVTKAKRVYFGVFIGAVLFTLQRFVPQTGFFLEASLLLGNVFAWILSPGFRQTFTLRKTERLAANIINFWFTPTRPFAYEAGQYLEYTLPHKNPDSRGVRRYFTIASSPTEPDVLMTSKFADADGSSFKEKLKSMAKGDEIAASRVAGEFVLPKDQSKKLTFIAGGIGITPFRSMVKYLLDQGEQRDIRLLYAANDEQEFVFQKLFQEAEEKAGLEVFYEVGFIDAELIKAKVPDFHSRYFYISGPDPMVRAISKTLIDLGVSRARIKQDFFPGYRETLRVG